MIQFQVPMPQGVIHIQQNVTPENHMVTNVWYMACEIATNKITNIMQSIAAPTYIHYINMLGANNFYSDYYHGLVQSIAKVGLMNANGNVANVQAFNKAADDMFGTLAFLTLESAPPPQGLIPAQDFQQINSARAYLESITHQLNGYFSMTQQPQQPVYQQAVQQAVYPQQPVYQQPVQQVVYPQQPVYQQAVYPQPVQQPVYQQVVHQQPPQQMVYQQPQVQYTNGPVSSNQFYNQGQNNAVQNSSLINLMPQDDLSSIPARAAANRARAEAERKELNPSHANTNEQPRQPRRTWESVGQPLEPNVMQQQQPVQHSFDQPAPMGQATVEWIDPSTPYQQEQGYQATAQIVEGTLPMDQVAQPSIDELNIPVVKLLDAVSKNPEHGILAPEVRDLALLHVFDGVLPEGSIKVLFEDENAIIDAIPANNTIPEFQPKGPCDSLFTPTVSSNNEFQSYLILTRTFEVREVLVPTKDVDVNYHDHQRRANNGVMIAAANSQLRNAVTKETSNYSKKEVNGVNTEIAYIKETFATESDEFGISRLVAKSKEISGVSDLTKATIVGSYDLIKPFVPKGNIDIAKLKETVPELFDAASVKDMAVVFDIMGRIGSPDSGVDAEVYWQILDKATEEVNKYVRHTLRVDYTMTNFVTDFTALVEHLKDNYSDAHAHAMILRPTWLVNRVFNFIDSGVAESVESRFSHEVEKTEDDINEEAIAFEENRKTEIAALEREISMCKFEMANAEKANADELAVYQANIEELQERIIDTENRVMTVEPVKRVTPSVLSRVEHKTVAMVPWTADDMGMGDLQKGESVKLSAYSFPELSSTIATLFSIRDDRMTLHTLITSDNVKVEVIRSPFRAETFFAYRR